MGGRFLPLEIQPLDILETFLFLTSSIMVREFPSNAKGENETTRPTKACRKCTTGDVHYFARTFSLQRTGQQLFHQKSLFFFRHLLSLSFFRIMTELAMACSVVECSDHIFWPCGVWTGCHQLRVSGHVNHLRSRPQNRVDACSESLTNRYHS